MKIFSIVNTKGGVGKSTLTVAVAFMMSIRQLRLLVVDLDDQRNTSQALLNGNATTHVPPSSYELMTTDQAIEPTIVREKLDVIPGSDKLVELESMDFSVFHRLGQRLRTLYAETYDVVMIDSPSTYCQRLVATLTASDYTATPIELDKFSLQALDRMSDMIRKVRAGLNSELQYLGVIPNRVNGARNRLPIRVLEKETLQALHESLSSSKVFPFVCKREALRRIQNQTSHDIFFELQKDKSTYHQVEELTDTLIKRIHL